MSPISDTKLNFYFHMQKLNCTMKKTEMSSTAPAKEKNKEKRMKKKSNKLCT